MKLCWLGIHKWNKWQDFGKPVEMLRRDVSFNVPISDWYFHHWEQAQKRTCENCGRVQINRYKI